MPSNIPQEVTRKIAERILLSHVSDIEWLSIAEMTADYFEYEGEGKKLEGQYLVDDEAVWHDVDAWLSKATITITFEED